MPAHEQFAEENRKILEAAKELDQAVQVRKGKDPGGLHLEVISQGPNIWEVTQKGSLRAREARFLINLYNETQALLQEALYALRRLEQTVKDLEELGLKRLDERDMLDITYGPIFQCLANANAPDKGDEFYTLSRLLGPVYATETFPEVLKALIYLAFARGVEEGNRLINTAGIHATLNDPVALAENLKRRVTETERELLLYYWGQGKAKCRLCDKNLVRTREGWECPGCGQAWDSKMRFCVKAPHKERKDSKAKVKGKDKEGKDYVDTWINFFRSQ